MEFKCISTGSKGNCYILENEKGETLIIELGIKQDEIFKNIKETTKIVGAIYTHNHGDHNLKARKDKTNSQLLSEWGIKVLGIDNMELGRKYNLGSYTIIPLPAVHDVPCYSYLIQSDGRNVLFATDTSKLVKVNGVEIDTFIVEVNYSIKLMNELLDSNEDEYEMYLQAVKTNEKHLALETLCEYFEGLGYDPKQILTIHGSGRKWFDFKQTKKELKKYLKDETQMSVVRGGDKYVL